MQNNVQSNEEMVFVVDGPPSNPCVFISVPSGLADKDHSDVQILEAAAVPIPCRRRRCRVFLGLMLFFGALFIIHHHDLHHRCHRHIRESFGYDESSSHGAGSAHHNHHSRHVIETPVRRGTGVEEVATLILREDRPYKKGPNPIQHEDRPAKADPIQHEDRPAKADPIFHILPVDEAIPEGWLRDRIHHMEKKFAEVTEEKRPVRPLLR